MKYVPLYSGVCVICGEFFLSPAPFALTCSVTECRKGRERRGKAVWYAKNYQRVRLRVRAHRNANLERERRRERLYRRRRYAADPVAVRAKQRAWYANNRERASAKQNANFDFRRWSVADTAWAAAGTNRRGINHDK